MFTLETGYGIIVTEKPLLQAPVLSDDDIARNRGIFQVFSELHHFFTHDYKTEEDVEINPNYYPALTSCKIKTLSQVLKYLDNRAKVKRPYQFVDIGAGKGNNVVLAKILGYNLAKGIEVRDYSKHWNMLNIKDRIFHEDVFNRKTLNADVVYMYEPINHSADNGKLLYDLIQHVINITSQNTIIIYSAASHIITEKFIKPNKLRMLWQQDENCFTLVKPRYAI